MLACIGCGSPKPEVYLFRNEKLFSVFRDKQEVYLQADRYFRKAGYTVRPVNFAKFTDLSKECDIVKNRSKALPAGAIFFMDNLGMTVFTNNLNPYSSGNYKLISFHYDIFAKDNIQTQTLLNFHPSPDVIYNAVDNEIRSASKTKDHSDVLYIYGSSYHLSARIAEMIKEHYPAVKQSNCTSKGAVKSAINSNSDCRCIIVFDFEYNIALTEIDVKTFADKTVVEVMSDYGETYPQISRSLLIDEPILSDHVLHSRQLQRYLSGKDTYPPKSVTNVELHHSNIVKAVSHTSQKESLGVILEDKIKENIKKKEEAEKKKAGNAKNKQ